MAGRDVGPSARLRGLVSRAVDQRPWMAGASVALVALLALWLAFELGRLRGADADAIGRLEAGIIERDATLAELRRRAAELDTVKAGLERERLEVSRTIGELQAQVARQAQELSFYRGIVVQGANAPEVAIREARVSRSARGDGYVLRLTLVQPVRPDRIVSGAVSITLEGLRAGKPARLDLAALTGGRLRQLDFSFRYFENLAPEFTVPQGFEPERLLIEVRSSRREVAPVSRTVIWGLEPR
jgi:hypothetical protein